MKRTSTSFVAAGLLGAAVFAGSCGAVSEAVQNATEATRLHAMPSGEQAQKAWTEIGKKSGVADPEMIDFGISYNKSIIGPDRDDVYLTVQMISPANKNKVVEYQYTFSTAQVGEPTEVTISTGIGSDETFIEKYGELQPYLFKKADLIPFEKLDALYKSAVEKSGYGADDCYVERISADKNNVEGDALNATISVQSTKSNTANKYFHFDKEGNVRQ